MDIGHQFDELFSESIRVSFSEAGLISVHGIFQLCFKKSFIP
jgi:hypothetical protein